MSAHLLVVDDEASLIEFLTLLFEEEGHRVTTASSVEEGRIKLEIAVARGKQQHDKRETLKRQDADREMRRSTGTIRSS